MKLCVATRSGGKAAEIRAILSDVPGLELVFPGPRWLPPAPDEVRLERGTTFAENAVLKARYFARRSGLPTVAEDSGLEVDALGGEPGVKSKRFAGEEGRGKGEGDIDAANNRRLLELLAGVSPERRTARYRCVVAYVARPDAEPVLFEGATDGRILEQPEGSGGFGYDPLFYSRELGMSFGLAAPADKHRVSHRGRAFRTLIEYLLKRSR